MKEVPTVHTMLIFKQNHNYVLFCFFVLQAFSDLVESLQQFVSYAHKTQNPLHLTQKKIQAVFSAPPPFAGD